MDDRVVYKFIAVYITSVVLATIIAGDLGCFAWALVGFSVAMMINIGHSGRSR